MPTEPEDTGFLSRWSRRKALQRQGVAPPDPAGAVAPADVPWVQERPAPSTAANAAAVPLPAHPAAVAPLPPQPVQPPPEPAPTMQDVALLTRESDYARFVAQGVQPEVKNAALAKLFTDPHFNVMDRLDVYIDDYGIPDPLPPGMLRQMLQAHVLGLFDDEKDDPKLAADPSSLNATPAAAAVLPPRPEPAHDEDTDLQLQPDDGAGRPGPEAGAGEHAGQPH